MRIQILLLSVIVSACMVGPNYRPPDNCVPDVWDAAPCDEIFDKCEAPFADWWQLFCDPLLSKYIALAACYNNDVLTAEVNILQARAMRVVAASSLFPQLTADLNVSRTYFSKNGPLFAGQSFTQGTNTNTGLPFQVQIPQIQNLYNALIDVSWEIDIFGKTRRGIEAAEANIGSAFEQRNDVLISVFAEVARNYIEIRSNQKRGVLVQQNIDLLEKNAKIARARLNVGYSNKLDLERIEAQLAVGRTDLPDILAEIYRGIYALATLTGNLPECLEAELLPMQPLPSPPPKILVGLRSDLLRRRPDVRRAERQLASATANIGMAVAAFFPTFTLIGDVGFQSLTLRKLFQAHSTTWSIGGDVNMPIFQGGLLIGNLRASEAATAAAAFTYQQKVLNAVQEAETALVAYTQEMETSILWKDAVGKNRRVVGLINERYTRGLINILDLLDSERQLNLAEQSSLSSETTLLRDLITLYKALGGGWEVLFSCE